MADTIKNPYDVLGIDKSADEKTIKTAYRKKSIKYHPDKNPGNKEAEEKFKECAEAYEILKDPQKRKNYDTYGNPDGPTGGFDFGGFGNGGFDFETSGFDPFSSFFGGGFGRSGFRQQRYVAPGEDIKVNIKLSIKEIYDGITSKNVKYTKKVRCHVCKGKGGEKVETCPRCQGTGKVRDIRRNGMQTIIQETVCPDCHGTGEHVTGHKCMECNGTGFKIKDSEVKVSIRPEWYINNGTTISMSGGGSEAKDANGQNGNLLATFIHDFDTTRYQILENGTILENINIDWYDAILGCKKDIILPNGDKIKLNIKECTKDSQKYKLAGKGMKVGHGRLDYYIVVKYKMPSKLSDKERTALEEIKK